MCLSRGKMDKRIVSVVIVTWDRRDDLTRAVNSIRKQDYNPIEIIIIDNGSTDGTIEYLKGLSGRNIKYLLLNKNMGTSLTRNIGVKKSSGKYVLFMDSDAVLHDKHMISKAVKLMESDKKIGSIGAVVYGNEDESEIFVAGSYLDWDGHDSKKSLQPIKKRAYDVDYITSCVALHRKDALKQVGGFDPSFFFFEEDCDLGIRLKKAGWKLVVDPEIKALHLQSKKGRSSHFLNLKPMYAKNKLVLRNFSNSQIRTYYKRVLGEIIRDLIKLLLIYRLPIERLRRHRNDLVEKADTPRLSRLTRTYLSLPKFLKKPYVSFASKYIKHKIQKRRLPGSWYLFITNRCNSRCKHCFYWKHLNKPKDLSLDEISKIFSKFYDVHAVSLGGGEPFMRKDIDDIIKIAVKYTNCKVIDIPTNCLIDITDKLEKILKENPGIRFSIHPSLDGLKEEHDYIRGVKGGFEKTAKLIHKLGKLKEQYSNFETLSVNTVVIDRNYEILPELIKFVKTLPVNGHTFEILRNNPQDELKRPSVSQLKKFGKLMIKTRDYYAKKTPLIKKLFYNRRIKKVWKTQIETLNGKKWGFQCTAGLTDLVIESDGTLRICEFLPKIGNLLKNTPEEILDSEKARIIFEGIKNHECDCTHNCNLTSSIPLRKLF